ncbi:cAMP-dependent protein kinase regulatory subunit [Durusdinium trenchii]|uniref:cAMP-dependent protein kinase regulatory subunit n=1 Tax=Durusdinium trenchii TaxID=1381693 RepID=A0ABP0M6H6_9DINO
MGTYTVRVVKVECSKYSTTLTAPGHCLPIGSQIRVTGVPELETERLIVDHIKGNTFTICRNVSVEIAQVDVANSIVRTQRPHQISDTYYGVKLRVESGVSSTYHIAEIIDDVSLRLEDYCKARKGFVPAKLPSDLTGTLSREHCSVVLPEACSGIGGLVSLMCQPPWPDGTCIREWRAALRAARTCGKVLLEDRCLLGPEIPEMPLLQVGQSGWDGCKGTFHRTGHLQYKLEPGLVSIEYIHELGWCLLAEVLPLYPLDEQRLYLGLDDWDGPQLLYVCQDSNVLGRWEPVIGPAPGIGSMVLDTLFNFTSADWRGGIRNGNVWGLSAVEAMLEALQLWHHLKACCAACRAWREALQPFGNLTKICHHALHIDPQLKISNLPSHQDIVRAIMFAASTWNNGLVITNSPDFLGRAWPAVVSKIRLTSEMGEGEDEFLYGPTPALLNKHADAFLQAVRQMLYGIPLPWQTRPDTRGLITMASGQRFAECDLLEMVRPEQRITLYISTNEDGHLQFLSLDGVPLLLHTHIDSLVQRGLRPVSSTRRWTSSRVKPREPKEPCGFPYCGKLSIPCHFCERDKEGRTRLGASQLAGGQTIDFVDMNGAKITLEIDVKVLPFFATSKDPSLIPQLKRWIPWTETESETESEWNPSEDETDAMNSDGSEQTPPRRRVIGKQSPPAWYRG